MNQIINDSKAHIWNFFFSKCYFGHATFLRTFLWTSSEFFLDFRFSSRKSQSQQKLPKKITHFSIRFNSKHLAYFINLNSLDTENNILPKHIKNLSHFTNFPVNIFLFGVRKKICNGPFLDTQELHSSSTLKANVCIFLYISLRKSLFQRRSKILSGRIRGGSRLSNFLKAAHCLDLVKCFIIFHLNLRFWKFNNSTSSAIP